MMSALSIREELMSFGFNRLQADVYEKFITTVLDALFTAEVRVKEKSNWKKVVNKDGALLKQRRINGEQVMPVAEEAITAELHVQLDEIKIHANDNHALRKLDIEFRLDPPRPSEKITGKKSKRPDLVAKAMHYNTKGVEIVFEAKNVFTMADLKNKYFGKQGVQCFTRKADSYSCQKLGAMIGYTINESEHHWLDKIKQVAQEYTIQNNTLRQTLSQHQKPTITTDLLVENETNDYVKLFHMIMCFNTLKQTEQ